MPKYEKFGSMVKSWVLEQFQSWCTSRAPGLKAPFILHLDAGLKGLLFHGTGYSNYDTALIKSTCSYLLDNKYGKKFRRKAEVRSQKSEVRRQRLMT
jgi:hypothetical protein